MDRRILVLFFADALSVCLCCFDALHEATNKTRWQFMSDDDGGWRWMCHLVLVLAYHDHSNALFDSGSSS